MIHEALTFEDLNTIVLRFQSSMHKLANSRDYPEREDDVKILQKLIEMKYNLMAKKVKKGEDPFGGKKI